MSIFTRSRGIALCVALATAFGLGNVPAIAQEDTTAQVEATQTAPAADSEGAAAPAENGAAAAANNEAEGETPADTATDGQSPTGAEVAAETDAEDSPAQGEPTGTDVAAAPAQPNAEALASVLTTPSGVQVVGADKLSNKVVTVSSGKANWDWVRSFRQYVGLHQEKRTNVTLDPHNNYLLWPLDEAQQLDLSNLQTLKFTGSVNWNHHGGVLDVTLANPTIDFVNKKLLVDGKTIGTLANPDVKVDKKQTGLVDLEDLKVEVKDGYLLITAFIPRNTHFSHELVGFYQGEAREPFVAAVKINELAGDAPEPILWQLFPEKFGHLRPSNYQVEDPNFQDEAINLDPALAKCVRKSLDITDENEQIMKSHMVKLKAFQCIGVNTPEDQKVRSLEGFQYAQNLSIVRLRDQRIEDLSPLRDHPNIVHLDISYNNLSEINGLGFLPKLTNLNADNNQLVNIDQVATLSNLERLRLNNNKLFHLKALPYDKGNLRYLEVKNNEIEDISPLSQYLYLKQVDLSSNAISKVDGLAIRGIERIDISDNFVETLEPLKALLEYDNLRSLKADKNKITDTRESLKEFGGKLRGIPDEGDIPQNDREKPVAKTAPKITTQPAAQTAEKGKSVTFTVEATGNPAPVYQWQRKVGNNWNNIPGAREASLTVTAGENGAINGAEYRVAVRNAVESVFSKEAVLTVPEPPKQQEPSEPATPSVEPSNPATPPAAPSQQPKPSVTPSATASATPSSSEAPKPKPRLSTGAIVGIIAAIAAIIGGIAAALANLPLLNNLVKQLLPR
ncbi:MAG: HtaA domain-containing protein [Corynebacterium sp.]|uniref:HtaA domain-containing protein n=1 Tax=Corynebacterium sp. TaxID=1720 RepID=UPI0026DC8EA2|nr:HtaA domain-containing protein [Corynebacterium sp.]MDO4762295.1 HtaA domain-containing protein [Corynebacterium sp.]